MLQWQTLRSVAMQASGVEELFEWYDFCIVPPAKHGRSYDDCIFKYTWEFDRGF